MFKTTPVVVVVFKIDAQEQFVNSDHVSLNSFANVLQQNVRDSAAAQMLYLQPSHIKT